MTLADGVNPVDEGPPRCHGGGDGRPTAQENNMATDLSEETPSPKLREVLHFLREHDLYDVTLPEYSELDAVLGRPAEIWRLVALTLALDPDDFPDTGELRLLADFPNDVIAKLSPLFDLTGPTPTGIELASRLIDGVAARVQQHAGAVRQLTTVVSESTRLLIEALAAEDPSVPAEMEVAKLAGQPRLLALVTKAVAALKTEAWPRRQTDQDLVAPGDANEAAATLAVKDVGHALWLCGYHPGDDPRAVFKQAARYTQDVKEISGLLAEQATVFKARVGRDLSPTLFGAVQDLLAIVNAPHAVVEGDADLTYMLTDAARAAAYAPLPTHGDAARIAAAIREVLRKPEALGAMGRFVTVEQQEMSQRLAVAEAELSKLRDERAQIVGMTAQYNSQSRIEPVEMVQHLLEHTDRWFKITHLMGIAATKDPPTDIAGFVDTRGGGKFFQDQLRAELEGLLPASQYRTTLDLDDVLKHLWRKSAMDVAEALDAKPEHPDLVHMRERYNLLDAEHQRVVAELAEAHQRIREKNEALSTGARKRAAQQVICTRHGRLCKLLGWTYGHEPPVTMVEFIKALLASRPLAGRTAKAEIEQLNKFLEVSEHARDDIAGALGADDVDWSTLTARARMMAATVFTAAQLQAAQDSPEAEQVQLDVYAIDPELVAQGLLRDYRTLAMRGPLATANNPALRPFDVPIVEARAVVAADTEERTRLIATIVIMSKSGLTSDVLERLTTSELHEKAGQLARRMPEWDGNGP